MSRFEREEARGAMAALDEEAESTHMQQLDPGSTRCNARCCLSLRIPHRPYLAALLDPRDPPPLAHPDSALALARVAALPPTLSRLTAVRSLAQNPQRVRRVKPCAPARCARAERRRRDGLRRVRLALAAPARSRLVLGIVICCRRADGRALVRPTCGLPAGEGGVPGAGGVRVGDVQRPDPEIAAEGAEDGVCGNDVGGEGEEEEDVQVPRLEASGEEGRAARRGGVSLRDVSK